MLLRACRGQTYAHLEDELTWPAVGEHSGVKPSDVCEQLSDAHSDGQCAGGYANSATILHISHRPGGKGSVTSRR